MISPNETFKRLQHIQDVLREHLPWLTEEQIRLNRSSITRSEYAWSLFGVVAELRRARLMVEGFSAEGPHLFTEAVKADPTARPVDVALAGGDPDVDPVDGKTEE